MCKGLEILIPAAPMAASLYFISSFSGRYAR